MTLISEEMKQALHEIDKDALRGDRDAVLVLVSLVREYRAALETAYSRTWGDGTLDGMAAASLWDAVAATNTRYTEED